MTTSTLSSQQLRSIVEERWQEDQGASVFGLHVAPSWQAAGEVEFDFGMAHVVRADSVFQVREAIRSAEQQNDRIILLTKLRQAELGNDVVARMARIRLFSVDHVASLCALFKAKELDRSICEPGIAQALLDHAPKDGYPPVSAGVLDAGTVWRAISRRVFEISDGEPDLISLLLWATTSIGPDRFRESAEDIRSSLRNRFRRNLGDAADSILRIVDSGAGPDALALAVVCQVVFGGEGEEVLDAAAARMEQYHQNKPLPTSVAQVLGERAVDAIADLDRRDDPKLAQHHLQRADELLRQFHCHESAYRNSLTRLGYEQRLERFGAHIETALGDLSDESIASCERLQEKIAEHRLSRLGRRHEQLERTEMACRLLRWLRHPLPSSPTFADMASSYAKELAFVDWAREHICRGEEVEGVSQAYQRLNEAIAERRAEFSEKFASGLADWTSVGSKETGVLGVEDVLSLFVANVVEQDNRVLMIVLDGMSWAVCHELLHDVRQDHWFDATLDENSLPPSPVIATLPSETKYSRTSLLSGELAIGTSSNEKRNFESNLALKQCCDRRYPPKLYHKKDITKGSRGAVSDELSDVILSEDHNIVGIVINAIDDRLANAQQVRDSWTVDRILPLGSLLRLARDSGRVVILASDHGHVWHRHDSEFDRAEEGSRWRKKSGDTKDGEIVLAGQRVVPEEANGELIAPWAETIHYKRQQHGYHGGATPQEMVCPLVILTDQSSAYSGLYPCEYPKPDWWSAAPVAAPVEYVPQIKVTVPTGQRTLFDDLPKPAKEEPKPTKEPKPAAADTSWISQLLESQSYKDQKSMIRRHAPQDDMVRACLEALNAAGGMMTPAAFSNAANIPAARLDPLVAQMRRILNVDGYEILTLDRNENKVELSIAKLRRQFDID